MGVPIIRSIIHWHLYGGPPFMETTRCRVSGAWCTLRLLGLHGPEEVARFAG